MKIELESPFKEKWRFGYIITNRENRKHVVLYNANWDRTTISYARYLMGVKLGHEVPEEFQVDHKDDDKTNDTVDNLQLLTPQQNASKTCRRKPIVHGTLTAYRYCKCQLCKAAHSAYCREYHAKHKK